jgi:iron complex outermembrane receptor protein
MSRKPSFIHFNKKGVMVGAVCVISLLLSSGQAAAQAGQVVSASGVLEEIVVTSRRREESLQSLPLSIVAITASQMQTQGIYSVDQAAQFVPNVTLTTSNRANQNRVVIRGIGGGHPDPVFAFGSGMYVDGHYMPSSLGGFMSTTDIERIELLRGPQGTLFGKNVTGGAVNIISTKPQAEFDSSILTRITDDGQQDLRAMVNIPLSDKFFARIGAGSEEFDGYYRNQFLNKDSGSTDQKAIRAAFRYLPSDNTTVDLVLEAANKRDDNAGGSCYGQGPLKDAPRWGGGAGNLERRLYEGAEQAMFELCDADIAAGDFVNSS